MLASFDQSEVLLSEQIDHDFVLLFTFHRCEEHLSENAELFEVTGFVGDLFDVLLFVVATPDVTLHLRFNVDDHTADWVKAADSEH